MVHTNYGQPDFPWVQGPTPVYTGPFRRNIHLFLLAYGNKVPLELQNTTAWIVTLQHGNATVRLHVYEELVDESLDANPACDSCRNIGWQHHPVCTRKYHFILPSCVVLADPEQLPSIIEAAAAGQLDPKLKVTHLSVEVWDHDHHDSNFNAPTSIFDSTTHYLHGVIHVNGYGHLVRINGRDGAAASAAAAAAAAAAEDGGGSSGSAAVPLQGAAVSAPPPDALSGTHLMGLWDSICCTLRAQVIGIEDVSNKAGMLMRLLYTAAHSHTWYGKWGYRYGRGAFNISEAAYAAAIAAARDAPLAGLLRDLEGVDAIAAKIVRTYWSLPPELPPDATLGQLLRRMLSFLNQPGVLKDVRSQHIAATKALQAARAAAGGEGPRLPATPWDGEQAATAAVAGTAAGLEALPLLLPPYAAAVSALQGPQGLLSTAKQRQAKGAGGGGGHGGGSGAGRCSGAVAHSSGHSGRDASAADAAPVRQQHASPAKAAAANAAASDQAGSDADVGTARDSKRRRVDAGPRRSSKLVLRVPGSAAKAADSTPTCSISLKAPDGAAAARTGAAAAAGAGDSALRDIADAATTKGCQHRGRPPGRTGAGGSGSGGGGTAAPGDELHRGTAVGPKRSTSHAGATGGQEAAAVPGGEADAAHKWHHPPAAAAAVVEGTAALTLPLGELRWQAKQARRSQRHPATSPRASPIGPLPFSPRAAAAAGAGPLAPGHASGPLLLQTEGPTASLVPLAPSSALQGQMLDAGEGRLDAGAPLVGVAAAGPAGPLQEPAMSADWSCAAAAAGGQQHGEVHDRQPRADAGPLGDGSDPGPSSGHDAADPLAGGPQSRGDGFAAAATAAAAPAPAPAGSHDLEAAGALAPLQGASSRVRPSAKASGSHIGPAPDDLARVPVEKLDELVALPEPEMHLRDCQRAMDAMLRALKSHCFRNWLPRLQLRDLMMLEYRDYKMLDWVLKHVANVRLGSWVVYRSKYSVTRSFYYRLELLPGASDDSLLSYQVPTPAHGPFAKKGHRQFKRGNPDGPSGSAAAAAAEPDQEQATPEDGVQEQQPARAASSGAAPAEQAALPVPSQQEPQPATLQQEPQPATLVPELQPATLPQEQQPETLPQEPQPATLPQEQQQEQQQQQQQQCPAPPRPPVLMVEVPTAEAPEAAPQATEPPALDPDAHPGIATTRGSRTPCHALRSKPALSLALEQRPDAAAVDSLGAAGAAASDSQWPSRASKRRSAPSSDAGAGAAAAAVAGGVDQPEPGSAALAPKRRRCSNSGPAVGGDLVVPMPVPRRQRTGGVPSTAAASSEAGATAGGDGATSMADNGGAMAMDVAEPPVPARANAPPRPLAPVQPTTEALAPSAPPSAPALAPDSVQPPASPARTPAPVPPLPTPALAPPPALTQHQCSTVSADLQASTPLAPPPPPPSQQQPDADAPAPQSVAGKPPGPGPHESPHPLCAADMPAEDGPPAPAAAQGPAAQVLLTVRRGTTKGPQSPLRAQLGGVATRGAGTRSPAAKPHLAAASRAARSAVQRATRRSQQQPSPPQLQRIPSDGLASPYRKRLRSSMTPGAPTPARRTTPASASGPGPTCAPSSKQHQLVPPAPAAHPCQRLPLVAPRLAAPEHVKREHQAEGMALLDSVLASRQANAKASGLPVAAAALSVPRELQYLMSQQSLAKVKRARKVMQARKHRQEQQQQQQGQKQVQHRRPLKKGRASAAAGNGGSSGAVLVRAGCELLTVESPRAAGALPGPAEALLVTAEDVSGEAALATVLAAGALTAPPDDAPLEPQLWAAAAGAPSTHATAAMLPMAEAAAAAPTDAAVAGNAAEAGDSPSGSQADASERTPGLAPTAWREQQPQLELQQADGDAAVAAVVKEEEEADAAALLRGVPMAPSGCMPPPKPNPSGAQGDAAEAAPDEAALKHEPLHAQAEGTQGALPLGSSREPEQLPVQPDAEVAQVDAGALAEAGSAQLKSRLQLQPSGEPCGQQQQQGDLAPAPAQVGTATVQSEPVEPPTVELAAAAVAASCPPNPHVATWDGMLGSSAAAAELAAPSKAAVCSEALPATSAAANSNSAPGAATACDSARPKRRSALRAKRTKSVDSAGTNGAAHAVTSAGGGQGAVAEADADVAAIHGGSSVGKPGHAQGLATAGAGGADAAGAFGAEAAAVGTGEQRPGLRIKLKLGRLSAVRAMKQEQPSSSEQWRQRQEPPPLPPKAATSAGRGRGRSVEGGSRSHASARSGSGGPGPGPGPRAQSSTAASGRKTAAAAVQQLHGGVQSTPSWLQPHQHLQAADGVAWRLGKRGLQPASDGGAPSTQSAGGPAGSLPNGKTGPCKGLHKGTPKHQHKQPQLFAHTNAHMREEAAPTLTASPGQRKQKKAAGAPPMPAPVAACTQPPATTPVLPPAVSQAAVRARQKQLASLAALHPLLQHLPLPYLHKALIAAIQGPMPKPVAPATALADTAGGPRALAAAVPLPAAAQHQGAAFDPDPPAPTNPYIQAGKAHHNSSLTYIKDQTQCDIQHLYCAVLRVYRPALAAATALASGKPPGKQLALPHLAAAVQALRDTKYVQKNYRQGLRLQARGSSAAGMLTLCVAVQLTRPNAEDASAPPRPYLTPAEEVEVTGGGQCTVDELKRAIGEVLADVYCLFRGAVVQDIVQGLEPQVLAQGNSARLPAALPQGSLLVVTTRGASLDPRWQHSGGPEDWRVACTCGTTDDDGERMIACDECSAWSHTRCNNIPDDLDEPPGFVCRDCATASAAAQQPVGGHGGVAAGRTGRKASGA